MSDEPQEPTVTLPTGEVVLESLVELVCELQQNGHVFTIDSQGDIRVNPDVYEDCLTVLQTNSDEVMEILRSKQRGH